MCADTAWANLVGRAGTGKTTVLRTVVDALHDEHGHHEAAADQVIVVSTSAMVARRSGDAIGADRSYSVEGFVEAVRHGVLEPTDRTWVIVEEAAMVDTPRMATLLTAAGSRGDPHRRRRPAARPHRSGRLVPRAARPSPRYRAHPRVPAA